MFLDIDHFKRINDTLGHGVGDAVLVELRRRLCGAVRPGDMLVRLAGDECAIVLEQLANANSAEVVADRILAGVNRPFELGSVRVDVHASIGIAYRKTGHMTAKLFLSRADEALYAAKAAGCDRCDGNLHRRALTEG